MENNNRTKIIIITMISVVVLLLIAITLVSSFSQKRNSNKIKNEVTNTQRQNNGVTNNNAQLNKISPTNTPSQSTMIPTVTSPSSLMNKIQPTQSLTIPNQTPPDNIKIAKKTLDYLNLMRDQRGAYLFERSCSSSNQCTESQGNNHSGPRPIWAWYKYFQRTKDFQSILTIKNDLLINTTKIETVQNDFWNCNLIYYISLDKKAFDATTIERMHQYCITSVNPNFTIDVNNQVQPVNKPLDLAKAAVFISDLVGRFGFSRNSSDLDTAKKLYQTTLSQYQAQVNTVNYEQVCTLGKAALDLFVKTGNTAYKNTAIDLWNNQKVFAVGQKQEFSVLKAKAICGLFANHLALLTDDNQYRVVKKEIISLLLANNYNSQDGSFFEIINGQTYKRSTENALIAGLLLEFDSFE